MASKWAFLRDRFPMLEEDPSYRDALDEQMRAYAETDLAGLARASNDAETELADVTRRQKELKLQITAVQSVLAEKMFLAGLDSIITEGYRWTPTFEPHPVETDSAAVREWAIKNGMGENLRLPWMTLKSVVKQALESEAEEKKLPPGLDVYLTRSFRKTKQDK